MSVPSRRPSAQQAEQIAARLRRPSRHGGGLGQGVVAAAVLSICLVGLVVLTQSRAPLARAVSSALAEKIAGSERVAYYLFDADQGPRFRLGPNDTSIKIITHLELPKGTPEYDPDTEYAYGVELSLFSRDGRELWRRRVNIQTRQSKAGLEDGVWLLENAFTPDGSRELTDDRLTRIELPEAEGLGDRWLELRLIPDEPHEHVRGLMRGYFRELRAEDERFFNRLAISDGAGRALVDRVTDREWESLSQSERNAKLKWVWMRLAADGRPGRDYKIMSIYETGFWLPRGASAVVERQRVEPTRWLAFNTVGPADLELRIRPQVGDPQDLKIRRYGVDGSSDVYTSRGDLNRILSVPAGVSTLVFETERGPLDLELEVLGSGRDRVWFSEAERPSRIDDEGDERLDPDLRRVPLIRLGENWHQRPRWTIVDSEDEAARMLRFDVRTVARQASTWPTQAPTPSVEYCFFDALDAPLHCETWTGAPVLPSHFEGLREGAQAGGGADATAPWYPLSEPQRLRVVAPEGARSVVLSAAAGDGDPSRNQVGDQGGDQARVLVRGYGYWPEVRTRIALPWREHSGEDTIWRYSPLETRTWFPMRPVNHDALREDRALADLVAQVRLQPRGLGEGQAWAGESPERGHRWSNTLAEDGWDPGPWVTVDPRGRHRRRSILERLDDDAARRLRRNWSASLFTSLRLDQPYTVGLDATGPAAPELHWQVAPEALGGQWQVSIDGRTYSHAIDESRGRFRLPVEDGKRRVQVGLEGLDSSDVGEVRMWIDRPVLAGSPPTSRRRTLHELLNTLVFPVPKPGSEAVIFNVVAYIPRQRGTAQFELRVDGGEPQRRVGVPLELFSVATRDFSVDSAVVSEGSGKVVGERERVRFVDLESRTGLSLEVVHLRITMGEDVVPGPHEISVTLVDGGRVWVRAFHRGIGETRRPASSWSERVDTSDSLQGER